MPGPSDEDVESRRRAMWALLVLVLVAVFVGAIMVFVLGTSGGGGHHDVSDAGVTPATTPAPSTTSRATHAATTAHSSPPPPSSTSASPKPTSTANPCPSAQPCAVPNDDGQAVQAVNAFRTSHGRPAVPGSATAKAAQCALSQGDGAACQPHYSWQPGAATPDGAKIIAAIAGRGEGAQWLLDPAMTSFNVGWAYAPGAGGAAGHYEFAVLKFG
jgi:hypothetical protein